MATFADNLINGNLEDAKQGAKRHSWRDIYLFLIDFGFRHTQAKAAADYLKGRITFQAYCDVEYREGHHP